MRVEYNGVIVPTAYIRVAYIRGDNNTLNAQLSYSASSTDPQLFQEEHSMPMDLIGGADSFGHNPFKQAYDHIKQFDGTVPGRRDFRTAIDV